MRLLHAADLHVDSPLRGLSAYDGAPVEAIRSATRHAVGNLVQLALTQGVDAVLLAGDIYDGDWPDYNTGLFFRNQMQRLGEAGVNVYLVSGNHDAASQITRKLSLPGNVREFSKHNAETLEDEALGLAVHGQGYAVRDVTDNLAMNYPAPRAGLFNVGLLHTALNGREGHARYAPCTVEQLQARGYDYWALGHVHTHEVVAADPHVVFPGNVQGRHAKETGRKGCVLIDVGSDGRASLDFRDLDVVRWEHLEVDASDATDLDDVLGEVRSALAGAHERAEGRLLAARVSIVGSSDAHFELWHDHVRLTTEVRALGSDFGEVWIEKVRPATKPSAARTDAAGLAEGLGTVADLRRTAAGLRADEDALRKLVERSPLAASLPPEALGPTALDVTDAGWRAVLFDQAVDLLVAMVEEGSR
ncbi:metallophosphoesterase family protein [Actinospica durhamensis]|nr:DNA repair exonuclease [Actinospica durhamensis]